MHEVNRLESLKSFGILHWRILAARCEINTDYLNSNQVITDSSQTKCQSLRRSMWLCLQSLFVSIRNKKQWISVIRFICPNDMPNTLGARLQDLSLIGAAVTVMFLSVADCPSAFPP
ncbi:hypothetical protein GOODEAATRI_002630 [Goodea atripinnis]|uniref:Uncharacterized protein n=1 Tax=Goodea atripinnis TaxID=208336 RepID=A0ABV0P140_9TELE